MVECERGDGDIRQLVRQVFDKDGTLLAEHDWLHDDPTFANFFLRSAAERGEWLPVKLRADVQPNDAPVSVDIAGQGQAPVFAGVDVQREQVSAVITGRQFSPGTRLEISLNDLGGWHVKASHPFGHAFTGYFRTDADLQKHLGVWLAELRAEAALGLNETMEESAARLAGVVAAGQGA